MPKLLLLLQGQMAWVNTNTDHLRDILRFIYEAADEFENSASDNITMDESTASKLKSKSKLLMKHLRLGAQFLPRLFQLFWEQSTQDLKLSDLSAGLS